MKYYLIYALAFLTLGWAVERMLEDIEDSAKRNLERAEIEAWSNGFARGVRSVELSPDEVQRPS